MMKTQPFQLLLGFDRRYRSQAAGLPAQQENREVWSGIGFRIGGQHYVAPMNEVGEVLPEPRFTQLPGVKSWVMGVANVRGRLLPVMDLNAFLGLKLTDNRKSRRVMVVEHQGVFAGLTVDEVLGMQHFDVDGFNEAVGQIPDSIRPYVHGTFQREHAWVVFSPHMLADDSDFLNVVA